MPEAVWPELHSPAAPEVITRFLATDQDWLQTRPSPAPEPELRHLDAGEREVIGLASRHMNDTLEAMGRTLFKSWFVDFDR